MNGEDDGQRLKPKLGLFDATAISIGAIIGGGIFVVTGIVAGFAGPALVSPLRRDYRHRRVNHRCDRIFCQGENSKG
ncbi:hypothetical protein DRO59_06780 [Candidatus Bathyarchaeota archaeon]|nr:MAG: hypothetical protein DRO59_06780 [Candidatus Bathyarchaeota archaeon]